MKLVLQSDKITIRKTNGKKMILDQLEREQALDPSQSFIVQAPAGSGKTELLVRRILILLAYAEKKPEEILAITFTRKAASEMRHRILQALNSASQGFIPEDSDQLKTYGYAQKVLEKDKKHHWNILQNPTRLRIQTIDSFCQELITRMPLLSQFGIEVKILEETRTYYAEAVKETLKTLEENVSWSPALSYLLLHLDNQYVQVENLFVDMLARRDQWLPLIMLDRKNPSYMQKLKENLEENLKQIRVENLRRCYETFPLDFKDEFISLIAFAAYNLSDLQIPAERNPILHCINLQTLPLPLMENHHVWLGISHFLLTKEYQWRQKIDKNLGFPKNSEMKQKMLNLLEKMHLNEDFRQALEDLNGSPPCFYTSSQWQLLEALLEVLPVLAAQLRLIFAQHGAVDFTEVSLAALNSLGDEDSPTDTALYLDYKIRHILVDEFQDTSNTQFKLLEKLVRNWQEGDGRTLFLVGDPMQSIYRFREAQVGLFLKAQQEGIGPVKLKSLQLKTNFRSSSTIVSWINTHFSALFPHYSDIASGAISYTPCNPIFEDINSEVELHSFAQEDSALEEAERMISIIQETQQKDPDSRIGILVRSRSHLSQIIPSLIKTKIPFSAVEVEALSHQDIVRDLIALTRALVHLADRTAWLSILRAPWCGLKLSDLHLVANHNIQQPIWETLKEFASHLSLSPDAKNRLKRIIPILSYSLAHRKRLTFRIWIEETWLGIGGPACLKYKDEINYAEAFFDVLEDLNEKEIIQPGFLEEKIDSLYISPKNKPDDKLQVMTIHKSKGLEFDTVIIPSLESKSLSDRNQLLMWLNQPRIKGENDLILAPIKASHGEKDLIYQYLRSIESKKRRHETARLLYVAVTRAKRNLHLLANIKKKNAPDGSFLSLLWPQLKSYFLQAATASHESEIKETITTKNFYRLIPSLQFPSSAQLLHFSCNKMSSNASHYKPKAINNTPQIMGILIHKILQKIAQEGMFQWDEEKILSQYGFWKNFLLKNGVLITEIPNTLNTIHTTITNTLSNEKGRWILDPTHLDSRSEFSLTTIVGHEIKQFIIDRTFIDKTTNIRWIIDYKTTMIKEETESLEQYTIQLNQYVEAMKKIESREIRAGLYFPLSCRWHEILYCDTSLATDFLPNDSLAE